MMQINHRLVSSVTICLENFVNFTNIYAIVLKTAWTLSYLIYSLHYYLQEEKTEDVVPIKETKQGGAVGTDVYIRYFKAGPGKLKWAATIILIIVTQGILQLADWWLAEWLV